MTDSATAVADPFTSSLAGRRLGRYEVLARLASGGMAGVYVARALGVAGFERLFAIKVLHPHLAHEEEFISMFLDEARLAARIRHPNVVPTTDISDTQDAGYYLVMDYIEGDHLGALLQAAFKRGQRLPGPVALRIVVDALDGLGAAHNLTDEHGRSLNLVHRDISPHNVMVSTDGIARITDFGVAKAEVRLSTTREGQFKGKLAYMAPEHASNGQSDQRSDLFAMGIILWESLTGRRLFKAENHAATLNKICLEPIPKPSSVVEELAPADAVLERALSRDPAQRFQTAEEFADAVEHIAPALGGLAKPREVGRFVKDLAQQKLERDQQLIREAIAQVSEPPPSMATASGASSEPASPAAPAAPPVAVPQPPPAGTTGSLTPPSEPSAAAQDVAPHPDSGSLADALEPEPQTQEPPAQAKPRRRLWLVATVLALVGAAVTTMTLLGGEPEEVEVTTSPLKPEPAAERIDPAEAEEETALADSEPELGEAEDGAGEAEAPEDGTAQPAAPSQARVERPRQRAGRNSGRRATRVKPSGREPAQDTAPSAEDGQESAKKKPSRAEPPTSGDDLMLNPYRKQAP